MKNIGNKPHLSYVGEDGWEYKADDSPSISVNPPQLLATWLNTGTGEQFVCTNNTRGANIWVGNLGTTIGV